MSTFEPELEISQEEFLMIRDFIHEKSGMFFAENKMYLVKNRLQRRMGELNIKTVRDYFYHVKYDVSMKEFNCLMDLMTTNETSFFRNEPQLKCFSDEVFPLIMDEKIKTKQPKCIKIWSAGCSTGEEPYTLSIIALEKFMSQTGWKAEIIANDISEQVLQKARLGEYSGITLRNVPPHILSCRFTKNGDNYRVNPDVKSLIKFTLMNLNDPRKTSLMSNMDFIFCRNVMIYFSDEVKKQVVRGFFNALRPGGYLYIGHAETLHGVSKAFKLVYFKNALVYQKEAKSKPVITAGRPALAVRTTAATGSAGGATRAMDLLSKIKPMNVKK